MSLSDSLCLTCGQFLVFNVFIRTCRCCAGDNGFDLDVLTVRKLLAVDLGINRSLIPVKPCNDDYLVVCVVLELEVQCRPVDRGIKTCLYVIGRPCVCITLNYCKVCFEHGIVKCRAGLADTAAQALLVLASEDNCCFLESVLGSSLSDYFVE